MNSRDVVKKVAINFLSELINKFSPLIILFYVPRILGVEQFGYAQFGISLIEMTIPFVVFGYTTIGSLEIGKNCKNKETSQEIISNIFTLRLIQAILASIGLILFTTFVPGYQEFRSLAVVLVFVVLFSSSDMVYVPMGLQNLHKVNAFHTIFKLIGVALIIIMVKDPEDATKYAFFSLAPGVFLGLYSSYYSLTKYPFVRPNFKKMKQLFIQSTKFAVIWYLVIIVDRFDVVIAEHFGGLQAAGLYAGPSRLSLSLNQLVIAIALIFYSEMLAVKNKKMLTKHITLASWMLMAFIAPVAVGIWFVKEEVLTLLFGEQFTGYGNVAGVLLTGSVFQAIFFLYGLQLLILKREVNKLVILLISALALGSFLSFTLYPSYKLTGIAIGSNVAKIFLCISAVWYSRPYLEKLPWGEVIKTIVPAGIMGVCLALIGFTNRWLNIPVGGIIFAAALVLMNRDKASIAVDGMKSFMSKK